MNLLRMRIHGMVRLLPLWLVISALNFGMLVGLVAAREASAHSPLSAASTAALAWAGIAAYLGVVGVRQRASAFELTLPVTARRLWLTHAASVLVVAVVLAFAMSWVAEAQVRVLGGRGSLAIGAAHLAALLVGGSIFGLALLETPSRNLHRIPLTGRTLAWSVVVLAGVALLLAALAEAGPALALVPTALGVVVGWRVWRTLPVCLTLHVRATESAAAEATTGDVRETVFSAARAARAVRWTIVRSVALTPKDAIAFPMLLFFGLMLGGALSAWTGDLDLEDLRFLYIPMASYVLFTLTGPRLVNLHFLDPLPIPRSRVLAWLLVPHFAFFMLGYGAGALSARLRPAASEPVQLVEKDGAWRLQVPLWARSIAWDGQIPEIGSPGQETHVPRGLPLLPGTRATLYSTYDTPPGSSLPFVAQQIERATAVTYGTAIPADEIATRYLETRPDGSVAPKAGGMRLRADYPQLQPRAAGPLLPFFVTLVAVPWLVLVAGLFRTYRPDVGEARGQQFVWGVIVVFLVAFIGLLALTIRGVVYAWLPRAVLGIAAHRLGATPAGVTAAWLGTVALVGLGFVLAGRQFRRMEIPTRARRFTLVNWSRDEC